MAEANDTKISGAGQIEIDDILIVNSDERVIDLSTFMVEFNLFEDIFSPCLTANLIISDGTDLISRLPIRGNELVVAKFRTATFDDLPENIIEKQFRVYSIENRINNKDTQSMYTLMLIGVEGFDDQLYTISKNFSGVTSAVAAQVFDEYIKVDRRFDKPGKKTELLISDAPHASKIKYVSNYWTPFKNMAFISKRVRGASLKGSDYLFFESNKNFYFSSVEAMCANAGKNGFLDEYVVELIEGTFPRRVDGLKYYGVAVPDSFTRIESMNMPRTVDVIEGASSGYFANSIRGYDLTTKKLTESNFDYVEQAREFVRTSEGIPIPGGVTGNPYMHSEFVPFNTSLFDDYGTTDNTELPAGHPAEYYTDRVHFRKSYLNSLDHMKFQINIPGRTDIEIGQSINIKYLSPRSKNEDDDAGTALDAYLSGPYIITALRHTIRFDKHTILAEVVKNGLNLDLSE